MQFVVTIPVDFARDLVRGDRPTLLVEADATDPAATSNAIAALISLNETALDQDLKGPLAHLKNAPPPFDLQIHRRYNEEEHHAVQHRAGPDGRCAHHDHGDDDRPCDDA